MIFFAKKKIKNKYLFILCPPFSGSTLLTEIIATLKNVSPNNEYGTREGQTLPSVRKIMFDHEDRWNPNLFYDWKFIKKEWLKHWDTSKTILLEKSPPNIIRSFKIQKVFKPAYFICMVRNPYARCERNKRMGGDLIEAAKSMVMQLKYQKNNIEKLDRVLFFTYEKLTENPKKVKTEMIKFIPELEDINIDLISSAHNFLNKKMKIRNLNYEKIKKLNREDLEKLNSIFKKENEILSYFGYDVIDY